MNQTIRHFMTPSPHTIGQEQSLERAHELMREHGIRHLPVLHGGKLVGLVSQRDLHLVETLTEVDPSKTIVAEAMSQEVYYAAPTTPLLEVVREMETHKYGSAIIVDGNHIVGIFTTTDALRALQSFMRAPTADSAPLELTSA